MKSRSDFDKIELQLVRVLHTVISERSVSKAALRLNSTQPAVSAQLRRLRVLTGDALLLRSGAGMTPTAVALALLEPAGRLLQEAQSLFGQASRNSRSGTGAPSAFDPATAELTVRIAVSDYLDPLFLPELVGRLQQAAPGLRLDLQPLSAQFDYRRGLGSGELDLVIGNWLQPPDELHLGALLSDEVVCLLAAKHPAAKAWLRDPASWTLARYLDCAHLAPMPLAAGQPGVIDQHLASLGLSRRLAVRSAHFGQLPQMVARSLLVLTTGRLFCSRYLKGLPVTVLPCPVAFPAMNYYQLWHQLTHKSAALRWLREQVRDVANSVAQSLKISNSKS